MRLFRLSGQTLHLFFDGGDEIPEAHLRAIAGSERELSELHVQTRRESDAHQYSGCPVDPEHPRHGHPGFPSVKRKRMRCPDRTVFLAACS